MRRVSLTTSLLLLAIVTAGCAGLVSSTNSTGGTQSPPVITNVQTVTVTTVSSQVTWTTNVPSNSSVDYGTTPAFGNSSSIDPGMVTSHQVTLTGLAAGTTYYYQVNSTNSDGRHGRGGGNPFKTLGFSLSGTINPATGGSGSTLTLSGAGSATTAADNSGNYTFTGLANGTYTIVPSHAGYTFTPSSQSMAVNGANIAGVNFTDNAAATAPTITTQPANQTITASQAATFAVVAAGTAPLSYQWQKNGANIGGATAAMYTTPVTTTADSGSTFNVVVSNAAGSVTSAAATLTVNASSVAPTIATQPTSQTVTAGQTAKFTVVAVGTAPLAYQWRKNTVVISGATSATYTTPATTSSDNGSQFTVVVSNTAGNVTSSAATLTVNAAKVAPSITTQPTSQTVTAGQAASFTVVAAGTAPLSYQWNKNGASISGATSPTYATPVTTSSDNGAQFTVIVSNAAGSVTSAAATLTVNASSVAPTIATQPTSQTVAAGQTATFTVVAAGTAPLAYQWRKNNVLISGATSASYTTPTTTSSDNGAQFTVVVSNSAGSVTSNAATLTVTTVIVPPSITSQPAGQTVTTGQTASFSVVAAGTAPLSYQWNKNGVAISGATSPTYTTPVTTSSDDGAQFTVVVSNTAGSVTSAAVTLTVNASSGGSIINVLNYGATGNGSTDDTAAVNNAIAALQPGDTLLFPCTSNSTYLLSSQLTLNISNVTVDGSSCAILHNTSSGTVMAIGGSGNGNPNYGPAVSLSSTANELATTFSTVSSLGVAPGDYLLLQQGGQDSSTGSSDTGCDPSGCRGEVLKVASVSGNSVTVTTALHDTYNPSVNGATAQKILNPLTAITVKNVTLDGNSSNVYGLALAGVAESSLSGVTSRNVQGAALLNRGDFNVSWTNISVTGAGSAQCGSAVWFEKQGNLSINGLSISNENQGASGSGCLDNGAFGFELQASANSTITNLSVDATGAYGRPFKTSAARYNTFNSPIVKNGVQAYNGISLEYYSSHNTYNSCTVTNNGAGTGTGTGNAGIITFGNFNQYNTFSKCTVSGNGNVQFYISGYDALRLAADSHNTISGGTFTGSNTTEAAILIEGDGMYITGATISGPGAQGIYLDTQATNACLNNNTFLGGTSLGSAISVNGSNDLGLGNLLNLLGSNLLAGICAPPLP